MINYVLASQSPRRKELMKKISSSFLVDPSNVEENIPEGLTPVQVVKYLAEIKGKEVKSRHQDDLVISADTIVVFNDQIIGKPVNKEDAKRILQILSDNTHEVYTAYHIFYQDQEIDNAVRSVVAFNRLEDSLIDKYIESGSPLDKAGAYGIQDNKKFHIIKKLTGSKDNVIGFPVKEIKKSIRAILD